METIWSQKKPFEASLLKKEMFRAKFIHVYMRILPVNRDVHRSSHVSGLILGISISPDAWQPYIHLYAYVSPSYRLERRPHQW